jgi:hypothetical protein
MIEVLIASGIFFQTFLILIPIHSNIQASQEILHEKRWAAAKLHEELQFYLRDEAAPLPHSFESAEQHTRYTFQFSKEKYVKGCVEWNNAKQQTETICLYGMAEE